MTLGASPRVVVSARLISQLILVASFLTQLCQVINHLSPNRNSNNQSSRVQLSVLCSQKASLSLSDAALAHVPTGSAASAAMAASIKWIPLPAAPTSSHLNSALRSTTSPATEQPAMLEPAALHTDQESANLTQLILDRFSRAFDQPTAGWQGLGPNQWLASDHGPSFPLGNGTAALVAHESTLTPLETRASVPDESSASSHAPQQQQQKRHERNFFRVHDRVFSRIELPDSMRRSSSRSGTGNGASPAGLGAQAGTSTDQCAPHVGCIEDLPNFPTLLKLKLNVSASFTIYTRDGPRGGSRIGYEPVLHHQLLDDGGPTSEWDIQRQFANSLSAANKQQQQLEEAASKPQRRNRNTIGAGNQRQRSTHRKRDQQQAQAQQQQQQQQLATTANSWLSAIKIARTQELPFDLAAIEQAKFNASQETRVIIGGYFAKEDEEWIDELVRQWLLLEPEGNVIKVSWQDSNRGLYHTAAHNSRIVGRQLSLFLHYLDQLYGLNLDKLHLVGHSLGAHIAGFVGADNDGQLARITGLDPAGPIFIELSASWRLDPSDAKFVDVLHTNGGTITKGALGLSTPLGHVDYYCNGGSLQPGCYFSSVTKSIMDPVERIACNHRRSYRYFTELIRLAIQQRALESHAAVQNLDSFPRAFLFREPKQEADLARLVHPDLSLLRRLHPLKPSESLAVDESLANEGGSLEASGPPLTRRIEFHLMRSADHQALQQSRTRGLYFFRTRSEAPFFGSQQYALTLRLNQPIKRKIALLVKLNSTLVADLELDELSTGDNSFLFVPGEAKLIDHQAITQGRARAPDLWIMWRPRSFNLLLSHHQSELQMNSIELTLMDNYSDPFAETPTTIAEEVGETLEQNDKVDSTATQVRKRKVQQRRKKKGTQHVFTIRYGNSGKQANQAAVDSSAAGRDVSSIDSEPITGASHHQAQQQHHHHSSNQTPSVSGSEPIFGAVRALAASVRTLDRMPILLPRNQWHKFSDGRPMVIESQVI